MLKAGSRSWPTSLQLPGTIARDVALCALRIAQEALNNVARHALATSATVRLRPMDGGLLLSVSDDGVGFDPDAVRGSPHLGFMSMTERAQLVGGYPRPRELSRQRRDCDHLVASGRSIPLTGPRRPRVLLADDHLMVAEALRSLLEPEFDLVGVVEDGRQLVESARLLHPDVIVADVTMPHLNGIDALVRLREDGDQVPVVFLTMHRDVTFARRALEAGASGYVLKHSASVELLAAVRAALEGKTYITPQVAGEVLDVMRRDPEAAEDPAAYAHAAATRGPATPR